MSLPDFTRDGYLPPGIHAASLSEVQARFGTGSPARQRQIGLLQQVMEAARAYPTIKRALLWGSFVTVKREPNDLDYSVVGSVLHQRTLVAPENRRFFVPFEARQFYGVDRNYLVIPDYPLEFYTERLDFLCQSRQAVACGVVEINVRGEYRQAVTAGESL